MPTKSLDQLAKLTIASDGLTAELTLQPGITSMHLNQLALRALIEGRGVKCGALTEERLAELLERYNPDGSETASVVVAEGIAPIHGVDGWFELDSAIEEVLEKARRAVIEDAERNATGDVQGSIDHYERSTIPMVESGDPLGRIFPPKPGTDGLDVCGNVCKAKIPQDAKIKIDDSVERTESGRLFAALDGVVESSPDSIRVNPDLEIGGSVDFSVGNVLFPGNVVIRHGVRDMFKVTSEKRLEIFDLVEAATLSARDLVLHRGMAGRGKGALSVERDAGARYIDSTACVVGRDLRVERELTNCELTVGRDLIAPSAAVMGGSLRIGRHAEVGQLGAESGTLFEVHLGEIGQMSSLLSSGVEQLGRLEGRIQQARDRLDTLQNQSGTMSRFAAEELTEIQFLLQSNEQRESALRDAMTGAAELALRHSAFEITVRELLNPGVVLCGAGNRAKITQPVQGPILIKLSGEEPTLQDLNTGSVAPLFQFAEISPSDDWVDPETLVGGPVPDEDQAAA